MTNSEQGIEAIIAQQRADLVGYLARVKGLKAPTRDLVFMHSEAGVASGLEAATSERLAVMARNGQTEGLSELLASLPSDQQVAAVENLARWAGTFALQPERENAIPVLLAATAAVPELPPDATALVAQALLSAPGEPPPGALRDIVVLAERCRGDQRRRLIAKLSSRRDLTDDGSARAALISGFPALENADQLYGVAAAMAIGHRDEDSLRRLVELEDGAQERLLRLADPTISGWLREAREKAENPPEGEEPGTTEAVNDWLVFAFTVTEGSRPAQTRIAAWLLHAGNSAADLEIEGRLQPLAPISDPDLLRLVLERMRWQAAERRGAWLEAVDAAAIDTDAAEGIDAGAAQLWSERIAPEADTEVQAPLLERLGELAQALPSEERSFPQLEAVIDGTCEAAMDSEPVAEERLAISKATEEFVEQELADTTRAADRFIASAAAAMGPLPPGELGQFPTLRSAASQLQADWLKDASSAALEQLRAAARQDDSAPLDATKAEALMRSTGRLAELTEEEAEPPLRGEAIGILARDFGEEADGVVEAWLEYFAAEEEIWAVLGPSWRRALSPGVRQAFSDVAKALSKEEGQHLVESAIEASLTEGAPPADNWEAVALREVNGGWLVRALAARQPEDGDLERWRVLLEIARQRTLSSRAKPLVASELLQPLIELGSDAAVELALDNLGLTGRRSAEEMLGEVRLNENQQAMAQERVKNLGWRKGVLSGIFQAFTGGPPGGEQDGE